MRLTASLDRLSGVDVRAAIRRTRLPFVASLFLAALLGMPAAGTAPVGVPSAAPQSTFSTVDDAPVSRPIIAVAPDTPIAAPASIHASSAHTASGHTASGQSGPALAAPVRTVSAIGRPAASGLRDQAVRAALAPRAPPQR